MSATQPAVDPDIVEKFHFTQAMLEGPIYRKYEKAMRGHVERPRHRPGAGRRRLAAHLARAAEGPARRHGPLPGRRAAGHERARPDGRRGAPAAALRLDDVPRDVHGRGGAARRVLHALAPARHRHARAGGLRAALPGAQQDHRPDRPLRDPGHHAHRPAELRRRAGRGLRRRQRGGGRAGLRALRDRVQRPGGGRADDAVVRDRDRHLRPVGRLPRAQAGVPPHPGRRGPAHHVRHGRPAAS